MKPQLGTAGEKKKKKKRKMKKRKKMNRKKNGKKKTILKKKKKKRNTKILSLNLKEISVLILFETSLVLIPNTGDIIDERRHLWASHLF